MKNILLRGLCAVLFVSTLSGALIGCNPSQVPDESITTVISNTEQEETETEKPKITFEPMELEEVYSLSFDAIGGRNVMPVAGYYGPYPTTYSYEGEKQPEMINDKYYQMIKDCGVNLICYTATNYASTPELALKMLELGDKYGIGCFVTDTKISSGQITGADAAERIKNYSHYDSFCGVHVVDEPYLLNVVGDGTRDMSSYAPVFDLLKSLNIVAGSNLLPSTSFYNNEGFEKYADTFAEICDAPYLSFDYYVFDQSKNQKDYFYNLSVYRDAANKAGIPLWVFVQAGSQWNDVAGRFDSVIPYYPSEGQFKWNVNTALAHGAKGIEYFPLIQPYWFAWAESTPFDFERNGLIGAWGGKTQWYYYAQDMQPHISAIDAVLMNSVNKGILASGDKVVRQTRLSNCVLEGTSWRELASITGESLVGCFNYRGKTALYVVNYDTKDAQTIKLTFHDEYEFFVIQDAEKAYYNADGIDLTIPAGEGALIVFESAEEGNEEDEPTRLETTEHEVGESETARIDATETETVKPAEPLPDMVGESLAGRFITSVDAQSSTAVISLSDEDNGYKTSADYSAYGLDYVMDWGVERELKILQLTDTQIIDAMQCRTNDRLLDFQKANWDPKNIYNLTLRYIEKAVNDTKPDLILLTGDLIYGEFDDDGTSLIALIDFMDSLQIPWAPVFGNHENESNKGVVWQCEQLEKSPYCLFVRRNEIGGNGNYSIGIAHNGKLERVIYMMDSNGCARSSAVNGNAVKTTVGFTSAQTQWLQDTGFGVNQVAGKTIPSFVCYHIPTSEVLDAAIAAGYQSGADRADIKYTIGVDVAAKPGDSGYKGDLFEGIHQSAKLLLTMKMIGTDGAFFGHAHLNSTSVLYEGIRWTFGLKTGAYDKSPEIMGGTLITLSDNSTTFAVTQVQTTAREIATEYPGKEYTVPPVGN